jgi:hypothetical protein
VGWVEGFRRSVAISVSRAFPSWNRSMCFSAEIYLCHNWSGQEINAEDGNGRAGPAAVVLWEADPAAAIQVRPAVSPPSEPAAMMPGLGQPLRLPGLRPGPVTIHERLAHARERHDDKIHSHTGSLEGQVHIHLDS